MNLSSQNLSFSSGMVYYYYLLSPAEQNAYRKLVAGIQEYSREIPIALKSNDQERIKRVITAVHRDRPDIFFIDFRYYRKKLRVPLASIRFEYLYSSDQIQEIEKALADFWHALKPKVNLARNIKSKYRILALEIGKTIKYRSQELCDYSVAGPMRNKCGACEAVSKLLVYLCRQAGIPAALVIGKCHGNGHAWVKVCVKNKIRFIDITEIQECPLFFCLFPWLILMPEGVAKLVGYREISQGG